MVLYAYPLKFVFTLWMSEFAYMLTAVVGAGHGHATGDARRQLKSRDEAPALVPVAAE